MELNGFVGKLYTFCEWVMRLAYINILLVVFNIPLAYLFLTLLLLEDPSEIVLILVSMIVFLPFMFFPSITALFAVVRKWVMKELYVPIFKTYWKAYRSNYLRSLVASLLFIPLWGIWIVDYFFFSEFHMLLKTFIIVLGIFLYTFTMYFFANTVHFHLTFRQTIKNSFFLAVGNPINTILLGVSNAAVCYIAIQLHQVFVIFFMTGTIIFLSFAMYYHNITRLESLKEEKSA